MTALKQAEGKVQNAWGKAKDAVKDAHEDAKADERADDITTEQDDMPARREPANAQRDHIEGCRSAWGGFFHLPVFF